MALSAQLRAAIDSAIRESRALSRQAATERLRSEIASAGLEFPELIPLAVKLFYDAARARFFASRYASAWLRAARATSAEEATKAMAARLEVLGATEAATAFNETRLEYARLIPNAMRMWDAKNDKRTCATCSAADGTVVGANESFPLGEPGAVHPNCMCTWHLLTIDEYRR